MEFLSKKLCVGKTSSVPGSQPTKIVWQYFGNIAFSLQATNTTEENPPHSSSFKQEGSGQLNFAC